MWTLFTQLLPEYLGHVDLADDAKTVGGGGCFVLVTADEDYSWTVTPK
jgi:hypothetical protein